MMKPLIFLSILTIFPASAADVALDIGHSIRRPGVVSAAGIPEWVLNRELAFSIAAKLRNAGISYRLIGADGDMDDLLERTALAKNERLFISLHHDSMPDAWLRQAKLFHGYSLFVSRRNPKLADSLACARRIGRHLKAAGFQPSFYHATNVAGENRPFADSTLGIHYYDGLAVLRSAEQPAVLIEAGVVVNLEDEIRITETLGRSKIARAVAKAIFECLAAKP